MSGDDKETQSLDWSRIAIRHAVKGRSGSTFRSRCRQKHRNLREKPARARDIASATSSKTTLYRHSVSSVTPLTKESSNRKVKLASPKHHSDAWNTFLLRMHESELVSHDDKDQRVTPMSVADRLLAGRKRVVGFSHSLRFWQWVHEFASR